MFLNIWKKFEHSYPEAHINFDEDIIEKIREVNKNHDIDVDYDELGENLKNFHCLPTSNDKTRGCIKISSFEELCNAFYEYSYVYFFKPFFGIDKIYENFFDMPKHEFLMSIPKFDIFLLVRVKYITDIVSACVDSTINWENVYFFPKIECPFGNNFLDVSTFEHGFEKLSEIIGDGKYIIPVDQEFERLISFPRLILRESVANCQYLDNKYQLPMIFKTPVKDVILERYLKIIYTVPKNTCSESFDVPIKKIIKCDVSGVEFCEKKHDGIIDILENEENKELSSLYFPILFDNLRFKDLMKKYNIPITREESTMSCLKNREKSDFLRERFFRSQINYSFFCNMTIFDDITGVSFVFANNLIFMILEQKDETTFLVLDLRGSIIYESRLETKLSNFKLTWDKYLFFTAQEEDKLFYGGICTKYATITWIRETSLDGSSFCGYSKGLKFDEKSIEKFEIFPQEDNFRKVTQGGYPWEHFKIRGGVYQGQDLNEIYFIASDGHFSRLVCVGNEIKYSSPLPLDATSFTIGNNTCYLYQNGGMIKIDFGELIFV